MNTVRILGLVAALASGTSAFAEGKDAIGAVDKLRDKGYSVTSITPIFGQLLKMSYPRGFVPVLEKTKADFYVQESVPTGESTNGWTQMITVTGRKDLASKPDVTPKAVLNAMAGGFKHACPSSYAVVLLSETRLNGSDAAVAVVSCGVSPTTAGKMSESAFCGRQRTDRCLHRSVGRTRCTVGHADADRCREMAGSVQGPESDQAVPDRSRREGSIPKLCRWREVGDVIASEHAQLRT